MTEVRYRIKRHFALIGHSLNAVELRSGVWNPTSFFVKDEQEEDKLYNIIKALDGSLSSKEIGKKYGVPTSHVEGVIDHLQQLGVLETLNSDDITDYFMQVCSPILSGHGYHKEKKVKPVLLLGDRPIVDAIAEGINAHVERDHIHILHEMDPLYQQLKTLQDKDWLYDGISFIEKINSYKSWQDYFIVIATTVPDPLLAKNINRVAYEIGASHLHVSLDGPFLLVGPTFMGNEAPCYECLEKRIMMNLRESASYQNYKNALLENKVHRQPWTPNKVMLNLLAAHACFDIVNFLLTGSCFTLRKMLGIYLPTMEFAFHEVLPLATCQVCGAVLHRTDGQLYFDMQTLMETPS